ncbi:serine/threonine-protein kinase [Streptomyces sp. NPDC002328]|uniref:serine/threonine-protein kinase n=1 Tax=Streptomyces sp. NPDC002328 TaxID=3364642 RepID=UPI0036BA4BDF
MQPLGADEPTAMGPYRLLGRLGSGGMGRVYLGRSAGGRTVAVKIVHPHLALDEEFRARFRREVDAARRVGGAWTASVLDADPEADVPWVATAYAAGPSLASAVAAGGALPAHTVRVLGAGLAEALAAVHALGLVHRDVKPSNVLLTVDGPLLIDFGIARATDGTASLTSTGVSVGSPGYMAPEQILGHGVTGAADVFSLGAVLAYAATGEPPFPGDSSAALLYKVVHEQPVLGRLEGELREAVEECLTKTPSTRPTPGELARRLAPRGTAHEVTSGWLPGPLVEQVGRSAVELLNLEAAGTRPAGPGSGAASGWGSGSGSAPASRSGSESGAASRSGSESGSGPASESASGAGAATGSASASASGPVAFTNASSAEQPHTPTPPGPFAPPGSFGPPPLMPPPLVPPALVPTPPAATPVRDGVPAPRAATNPSGPGKLSVTVAATATPGEGGRGRRLSCTVALAVAGALAAVTVGSAFLFDLLPGTSDDPGPDSADGAYTRPPAASTTPQTTALPSRYLGTWEGEGSGLDGKVPMGTFRLTARQASVGGQLGQLRQTDILGGVCVDILTLKEVTPKEVIATSTGAPTNHDGCNPTPHTIRLTPTGDDLTYRSESEAEGNPVARLSRVR